MYTALIYDGSGRLHSCRARFLLYLHNYLQTFAVFFTNYFWHHYQKEKML